MHGSHQSLDFSINVEDIILGVFFGKAHAELE